MYKRLRLFELDWDNFYNQCDELSLRAYNLLLWKVEETYGRIEVKFIGELEDALVFCWRYYKNTMTMEELQDMSIIIKGVN